MATKKSTSEKIADLEYKYIARPLFKMGESLGKESKEQSISRHKADAARIDSGKTLIKDSSIVKRRIMDLENSK